MTVDHSDIDPTTAVIQAEFVDDQGVRTSLGVREQPLIGGLPDITISKRSCGHADPIAAVEAKWQ